ncbi:LysE family translocator [Shewanella fodinae]|uniref:Threonine/homoserine/homoserine lactone efflux protein n=1 Tax=Shewanella fodinae TaxID=552357 RepID=A0A4V6NM98_9GAMM|nr:LysE family translocator [Shewanella fodinae]TCN84639.1 threonine/homoserine/homoserine lactone efflux protein [Shewanella fodinae]
MFGTHDIALFMLSGLLLNLVPGPDSLLIISKSATHGWRAGCVAALGIGSGLLVHIFAAALGLSAILASSATAFTIVKIIGAIYLIYIGINALLQKANHADTNMAQSQAVSAENLRQIYVQGFFTNALNPKVALFFLAFVPQFISQDADHKAVAFMFLGLIFECNSMLYCLLLAVLADSASKRLKGRQQLGVWLNKLVGTLFVSLGIKLALASRG